MNGAGQVLSLCIGQARQPFFQLGIEKRGITGEVIAQGLAQIGQLSPIRVLQFSGQAHGQLGTLLQRLLDELFQGRAITRRTAEVDTGLGAGRKRVPKVLKLAELQAFEHSFRILIAFPKQGEDIFTLSWTNPSNDTITLPSFW